MKYLVFAISSFFFSILLHAQDSLETETNWELKGYVSDRQSLRFDKHFDNLADGNVIHNRINFKWKPSGKFTAAVELRNRLFWGDEVAGTPGFARMLKNENEVLDLSKVWISKSNYVLHTNVERLWMEYRAEKWNARLGRQRINWGMATSWNPNDIFNTYNFLDFEYAERPGSDAALARYLFSDFSNIEIAVSPSDKKKRTIAAARYSMNKWGYDLQFLAGVYQHRATLGLGWAGSVGNMGFKGEVQFLSGFGDTTSGFNGTMEFDYACKKGWYLGGSFLYNKTGLHQQVDDWTKIDLEFSPENLMPAKWNFIITASKEFTPLLSGTYGLVYSPQLNLLILLPGFRYNIATNLDVNVVWQSFFVSLGRTFQAVSHNAFLLLKWSF